MNMRIKELQKELRKNKIDAALIFNSGVGRRDPNLFYFTRFNIEFACLVIYETKKPLLIVPEFEKSRAKKESEIKNIKTIPKKKGLFKFLKSIIKNKIIGIDENNLSVYYYKLIKRNLKKKKFKNVSKILLNLRKIKSDGEIRDIKRSCEITDKIFKKLILNFKEFEKESDIERFIIEETIKNKCEVAFSPIVASGKNASLPHYSPKDLKLKKGFCVIDFGVKYGGYCSDITRTVYIGKIKEEDRELYTFLLNVQKEILKNIKMNKKCSALYKFATKRLEGYKKYFTHGLGHGIGIEVHELPSIVEESVDRFNNKMVFTIEPGLYMENKGMRVEDDILINGNRVVVLTKSTKKLIIKNEI